MVPSDCASTPSSFRILVPQTDETARTRGAHLDGSLQSDKSLEVAVSEEFQDLMDQLLSQYKVESEQKFGYSSGFGDFRRTSAQAKATVSRSWLSDAPPPARPPLTGKSAR